MEIIRARPIEDRADSIPRSQFMNDGRSQKGRLYISFSDQLDPNKLTEK